MIVLGEALVDVVVGVREQVGGTLAMCAHAGGGPANVAVGLGRLGVPTQFAARISRDRLGRFLREHLRASGVDLSLCVETAAPATLAMVALDAAGVAEYSFYLEGTADWAWEAAELPTNPHGVAVHTGSLAIGVDPGAALIADWIAAQHARGDVFVSLDPNIRPALVLGRPGYRERLEGLLAAANLVKVSEQDLEALEPGADPLATAAEWARRGPELVVLTHGARGATALRDGMGPRHCDAVPVTPVDTIGAGDAFMAGLLAFLAENGALSVGAARALEPAKLAAALRFAGAVAALTCSRAGADPPRREQLGLDGV